MRPTSHDEKEVRKKMSVMLVSSKLSIRFQQRLGISSINVIKPRKQMDLSLTVRCAREPSSKTFVPTQNILFPDLEA